MSAVLFIFDRPFNTTEGVESMASILDALGGNDYLVILTQ